MRQLRISTLELPDETMDIIATKPPAMPMEEFIGFLVQFGAWRYRDAYQHDRLDHIVQQMNIRLMECYRQSPGAVPQDNDAQTNVVALVPKPKEPA